jgi:hypothetical protein
MTINGIDFIRRFGESCGCWVVGDIKALPDRTAGGMFSQERGLCTGETVAFRHRDHSSVPRYDFCCG